ncbi:uncharacterized protein [Periplaneta americana]|uniref:uncharacterized protein isoform X2 n=1 Tax=Periplaneta americana TaxID=6978 RepID=UPI0037E9AA7E
MPLLWEQGSRFIQRSAVEREFVGFSVVSSVAWTVGDRVRELSLAGMTRLKIPACSNRGLLAFLPVIFFLQLDSGEARPSSAKDHAATALNCLLRSEPPRFCAKTSGYMLPDRFLDIYNNLSEEVKESIRAGKLETLTPDTFAKLHISLFLLIPSSRLKNVSGSSFAALLSSYPQDVSVAVKIMGTLKSESIRDFFEKLQEVNLSPENQYEIAKALVKPTPDVNTNWTYTRFRMIEGVGSPLLAYIPPYYLANLTKLEASKFLFHLRNWLWSNLPADMWSEKLEASKRAWTDLMFRSSYPFSISEWKENEGRRYFLEGATPDELKWLTAQQLQSTKLFKTHLSRLQVQTLFNILYSNGNLSSANLTERELLPVALQLSPANLQRFNINTTDFRVLTSLFIKQEKLCSYATAKQILQSLIAQSVLSGRLESERPETWGDGIEHLGKFIYILPAKALEPYKLSPPSALVQSIIDSDKITARQARMLTGGKILNLENPDFMLSQKGLLRALPSSQLVAATTLPQFLLSHLLANLPSDLPVKVAAILQKVKKLAGDPFTLKTILTNKERNQFFKIMPSRTIATIITDLQNIKDFDNDIKQLPQNTLSVWLAAMRTKLTNKNGLWTSDILLSNRSYPALLGLSCNDIYAMETVDFIYIMEQYNRARKNVRKPFPKDLQYCSQMALMNYLEMKASLQVANHSPELLDYLQPAEIAAVGGYILSTLPAQDIEVSSHSQQILEAIGQLPFPELLVATKESKPQMYAKLLLKTHAQPYENINSIKAVELFSLGNLVHFLTAEDIVKINSTSFKLFIESVGDSQSKTVCADSATRAAWYQILLKTFGDTFTWTAGTLAILGDFLAVVPTDGLNSVPEDSWREAADTLVEQSSYHVKVDWPGKVDTIPIYQACAEVLDDSESADYIASVRGLTRWYLAALQNQLNTVVSASQLIDQSKKVESKRKMVIPDVPVEMEHPESIVKVLEPDEEEEPIRMKRPGAEMDFTTDQTTEAVTEVSMKDYLGTKSTSTHSKTKSTATTSSILETSISYSTSPSTEPKTTESTSIISSTSTSVDSFVTSESTTASVLTSIGASTQSSDASLVQNGKLNVTIAIAEVVTQSQLHTSTQIPKSSSPENVLHGVNTIENEDDSYSIMKTEMATESGKWQTTVSPNSSIVTEFPRTTFSDSSRQSSTGTSINQVNESVLSNNSSENISEHATVFPLKAAEDVQNKLSNSEENARQLENASLSLKEQNDSLSTKLEEISQLPSILNSNNTKTKRHVNEDDLNEELVVSGNTKMEQSRDILRAVLVSDTSHSTSQTSTPIESTTEVVSLQPKERTEMRYWQKLSCDAIRAAGPLAALALDETDVGHMGSVEVEKCADVFGTLDLDSKVQKKIWSLVNKEEVLDHLSDLGKLVKVLDVDDISRIDLNLRTPYTLDNLAIMSEMIVDTHVLHEVGSHFVQSNYGIKKMTTEIAVALGRILCEVVTVTSQRLHDLLGQSVFLEASPVLGRMKDCPTPCLYKFAMLAMRSSEYGPLETWTAEDVATLGVVLAGLKPEHWRQLSSTGYGNNPLVGLTPSAIKCIPPQIFKELDEDQLKSLSTLSAAVVSEEQLSHLSESQQLALVRVQRELPVLKHPEATNFTTDFTTDFTTEQNDVPTGSASQYKTSLIMVVSAVIFRFSM